MEKKDRGGKRGISSRQKMGHTLGGSKAPPVKKDSTEGGRVRRKRRGEGKKRPGSI